jgi:stress-induced morphogen
MIEQHKMVYNSLKGRMGNELHALEIKTKEWNGSTNKRFD